MDIKILDSHLREHLQTNATPMDIAKAMSLTSASIERVEPFGKDFLYSIEIPRNILKTQRQAAKKVNKRVIFSLKFCFFDKLHF